MWWPRLQNRKTNEYVPAREPCAGSQIGSQAPGSGSAPRKDRSPPHDPRPKSSLTVSVLEAMGWTGLDSPSLCSISSVDAQVAPRSAHVYVLTNFALKVPHGEQLHGFMWQVSDGGGLPEMVQINREFAQVLQLPAHFGGG